MEWLWRRKLGEGEGGEDNSSAFRNGEEGVLIVMGVPLYIGVGKGLALALKLAFASLILLC